MKTKLLFIILGVAAFCAVGLAQSVVVTGKKVTYTRPKPIMDEKKTFQVNHPKVRAATPALSKRIETAISFEKVIPLNIKEEINDVQWLEEADFEVGYNKNGILTVSLTIYGVGAYPSSSAKTVVVDTRTGNRVKPADIFVYIGGLTALVRRSQKKEIAKAIVEIKKDPDYTEPDPESLFTGRNFTAKDLNEFSVGEKGVTFMYDYGFPHVIQALQPDGNFFFTWTQLKPYIKPRGLLTRIAR